MIEKECGFCHRSFKIYKYREKSTKYCSLDCRNNAYKDSYFGKEKRQRCNCALCGKEIVYSKSEKRKFCSRQCSDKGRNTSRTKGSKHWNWNGGTTKEDEYLRRTKRYRDWRDSVFKRDNYICVACGRRGGILNADHIKPWSRYRELRFDINNGRTLCIECHRKTPTYGERAKTWH